MLRLVRDPPAETSSVLPVLPAPSAVPTNAFPTPREEPVPVTTIELLSEPADWPRFSQLSAKTDPPAEMVRLVPAAGAAYGQVAGAGHHGVGIFHREVVAIHDSRRGSNGDRAVRVGAGGEVRSRAVGNEEVGGPGCAQGKSCKSKRRQQGETGEARGFKQAGGISMGGSIHIDGWGCMVFSTQAIKSPVERQLAGVLLEMGGGSQRYFTKKEKGTVLPY